MADASSLFARFGTTVLTVLDAQIVYQDDEFAQSPCFRYCVSAGGRRARKEWISATDVPELDASQLFTWASDCGMIKPAAYMTHFFPSKHSESERVRMQQNAKFVPTNHVGGKFSSEKERNQRREAACRAKTPYTRAEQQDRCVVAPNQSPSSGMRSNPITVIATAKTPRVVPRKKRPTPGVQQRYVRRSEARSRACSGPLLPTTPQGGTVPAKEPVLTASAPKVKSRSPSPDCSYAIMWDPNRTDDSRVSSDDEPGLPVNEMAEEDAGNPHWADDDVEDEVYEESDDEESDDDDNEDIVVAHLARSNALGASMHYR